MDVNPLDNRLLAQLGPEALGLLVPHLRGIAMEPPTIVHAEGSEIENLYFPTSGLVSLVVGTDLRDCIEVGLIGNEGVVGGSCALGITRSFARASVQVRGAAVRLPVEKFMSAYEQSPEIRRLVGRYNAFLLIHAQQSAACNAVHPVSARMCRWLLEVRDRVGTDKLYLRQEFLAQMLGVQRTTVTLTEGNLKAAGLVSIGRGYIEIKDVDGIRRSACGCYGTLRECFESTRTDSSKTLAEAEA